MRVVGMALAATAAAACQPLPPAGSAGDADAQLGLAFAKTSCGGCHAIEQRSVSPNPNAPPFARIVNQEGLTANTLSVWLRNAHNYPDQMKFTLEDRNVDELVAYMLTLRDPNFRPEI
ncbi:MAG TPA: cytochrome c [Croceibacterium sp.]|nr:cytochrome c [Croceibacterium sp.]